jgi:hypothetical protein
MSRPTSDQGQAPGWCVHYGFDRSQGKAVCAVGLDPKRWLEDFKANKAEGQSYINYCPCYLTDAGESQPDAQECQQLRRPTPEEMAAHKAARQRQFENHMKVSALVVEWRQKHKGQRFGEHVDCPACGGKGSLGLSIAGRDHVHGECKTEGCVSWME